MAIVTKPIVLDETVKEFNENLTGILNNLTKAEEKANEAAASAALAGANATNAASSASAAQTTASTLTEFLNTKATLTAPAVDAGLSVTGAAADANITGQRIGDLRNSVGVGYCSNAKYAFVRNNNSAITVVQEDDGFIRILKQEGFNGNMYQGIYLKVPFDNLDALDGNFTIENIQATGTLNIMHRAILPTISDWGSAVYVPYETNLKEFFERNASNNGVVKILEQRYFYIVFVYYGNSTTPIDTRLRVLIKPLTKPYINIDSVSKSKTSNMAQYAINAGFEYALVNISLLTSVINVITDSTYAHNTVLDKKFIKPVEHSEKGFSFKFENLTNTEQIVATTPNTRLWSYATAAFKLNDIVGKGYKLKIDCTSPNYSGNSSNSVTLARCSIGTSSNTWGGTVKMFTTNLGVGIKTSYTIDVDAENEALGNIITKTGTGYYLLFAIEMLSPLVSNVGDVYVISKNDTDLHFELVLIPKESRVIATEIDNFEPTNYYTKAEVDAKIGSSGNYITCWGDSLTAGGGWTDRLATLTGMTVKNGGTGGESARTIVARQGADVMMINNITIPASVTPVQIASMRTDSGINTYEGYKATPLLQGGAHVNPCKIGDVEGTLRWTGSNYSDTNGTWTFTRSVAGNALDITRPTAIRTDFDRNWNSPHLMVIFIGQNGGYSSIDDLIRQHKLMMAHSNAKHTIILGLSSGSASARAEYEQKMQAEFGRYFISLRKYLATPLYNAQGSIVSCYGLADQNVSVDTSYTYGGKTTLQEIAEGTVPHQILADSVHFTTGTKTVIGDLIYKKCCELGIF